MITNGDVTIYNRYVDKDKRLAKYKRTVLKDVYIEQGEGIATRSGSTVRPDDKAFIIIYASNQPGYVKPKEFSPEESSWTLTVEDIVVLHEVPDEIESVKELETKYDDVHKLTAVGWFDGPTLRMSHWEVTAK